MCTRYILSLYKYKVAEYDRVEIVNAYRLRVEVGTFDLFRKDWSTGSTVVELAT